ncbi:HD-domain/PDEase-like protein [Dendrothele bispora CBS 962.96]|uniref:HD-domain/PDEase-like protein n=1 Tax=Dendrothele bispora (strain CBS 962.96) TaxID=1314807 RepID=A0A4S8MC32_DENBC|nr:HD-domain/PDEase-like protein [Dendrothele bispora CBS 962.96]
MHIDECEDSAPRSRFVKDPIHDLIEISPRLSSFLDTRQFQRLRNIKQLGTTYYVWIGACHNRFEHCIGVAHLSRLLASHIKTSQPELNVTDRDVECVAIAGLCHDLGHGPWSHVFDGMFIPKTMPHVEEKDRWTHEKGSEMMFDFLVQENNIEIDEHDKNFIKALIAGEHDRTPSEKSFLFDIVANKRNGLDVDKFDYIARDSHMAGHAVNINTSRILQSARVLNDQICYDIKDVNNIYEICATRFRLHKMLYNHKTAKAIEYMIIDVLLSADKYLGISDSLDKPEKYLRLTDSILETIEASEVEELKEARQLVRRIRTRDLYRRVDYKVLPYDMRNFAREKITPQRILDAVRERFSCHGEGAGSQVDANGLGLDDIIVDFSTMHYGMKEKNPLDKVMFYSKSRPNQCYPAQDGDYSFLRPTVFAEVMLQVFTKNPDFYGVVQAGYRAVVASLGPEPFRSTASTAQQGRTGSPDVSEGPPTPRDSPMATPTGSVTDILQSYASLPSIPSTTPGGSCLSSLLRENEFTKVDASYRHISPVKQLVKPRSTSGGPGGSIGSGGKVFPTSGNSGSVIEMQSLGEKRPRDYTGFMEEPGSPSPKRRKAANGAKG